MCGEKGAEQFRVTKDTYRTLMTGYAHQFDCSVEQVTNDVCVCPKGTGDWLCATDLYTKCYVNITDPPLYKGCADKPDSAYYLYSVPGFSPCFFFDFTSKTPFNLGYELNCRTVNTTGQMEPVSETEFTGY